MYEHLILLLNFMHTWFFLHFLSLVVKRHVAVTFIKINFLILSLFTAMSR